MYGGRVPKGELCNKVCMYVCMYVCIFPSDSVFFPSFPYPSDILCQMLALLKYISMCKIYNFHSCGSSF